MKQNILKYDIVPCNEIKLNRLCTISADLILVGHLFD